MGAITINSLAAVLLWVWSAKPIRAQIISPPLCEKQYEEDGDRKEFKKCMEAASFFAQGATVTTGTPGPTETTPLPPPPPPPPPIPETTAPPGASTPPKNSPPSRPDSQSGISITATQVSGTQSASLASSRSVASQSSDSLQPAEQSSSSVLGLITEYQAVSPTPSSPSKTGSTPPNPVQTTQNDHHIPVGPIVGAIIPIIIFLIVIFIYCVRRKRISKRASWISPWISKPTSPNSSEGKLKQPSDPEKRLLSQLDLTERNDEGVDLLEDLSPVSSQAGTQRLVAGHDKESQLRDFIRNHYGPSSPSEPPSLGTSDRPPPY